MSALGHILMNSCNNRAGTSMSNTDSTPDESLGEDEKGERAWEDMDCGDVLPDVTGPSVACTRAVNAADQYMP